MKKELENKYDSSWYLFNRLFKNYIRPLRKRLSLALLCMLVSASAATFLAWVVQPALDYVIVGKNSTMHYLIPIVMILIFIINGVASFYDSIIMKRVGQQISSNIQMELYEHLIYADLKFLAKHPSGNLISRFTNDINILKNSTIEIYTSIIKEFFTLFGLVILMFKQSFSLTLIIVIFFLLAFYPVIRLGKRMKKISKNMQEKMGDFTVRLDETFQNIKLIKSYCREEFEINRAKTIIDKFLSIFKKAAYVESSPSAIMEILGGLVIAVLIFYVGFQETTSGEFLSFITALLLAYKPLKALSRLNALMQEGLAASRRLFIMLDVEPEAKIDETQAITDLKMYNIKFSDVFFSYKLGQNILNGINIDIKQGQTIALVGGSGVGKTTVLNLLQRLYNVSSGDICIGDININDIRLDVLRKNIAFVSQDVNLFDDTIMENIRYGKLDATDEEILDASMIAAAHEFITELPNQYNTSIGQNGVKLSGGQKQRLAIARAVLKNAPILLLDEATSSLDAISEKKVQMALDYLKKDKTTIVIAHRLSTIESADVIFVLSDGKIEESGNHDELILNSGEYARLYEQYKSNANNN